MCPCGKAVERRTHVVGKREMYKEERDVLEEMRKTDECEMEKFGGYKTDVKERKKNKGKASAKEQGERGILKRCKAGEEKI